VGADLVPETSRYEKFIQSEDDAPGKYAWLIASILRCPSCTRALVVG